MKFLPRKHQPDELDMSPLIDMVFILLIFFAVSTTFVQDMQLELERPNAQSSNTANSESIRVYIDQDGGVFVDETAVNTWMVQSAVRDLLALSASETVLVIADRGTPAELLIEVVDQARLAGAADVGVATEQQ